MKKKESNSLSNFITGNRKWIATWLGILLGVLLLGGLTFWTGASEIIQAFRKAGPAVLLLVFLYPIELFPYAYSWFLLYPAGKPPRFRFFVLGMWLNNSVNRLLPTASLGGDFVRGRMLIVNKYSGIDAVSSLIADKTAQAVSVLILLIAGILLTIVRISRWEIIGSLILTSVLLAVGIWVFFRIQRSSGGGVSQFLARWEKSDEKGFLNQAGVTARKVEKRLNDIYNRPMRFVVSVFMRSMANIGLAVEVWFAAWLIGTPISLFEALTLRLVGYGVRSAAFIIWGGIGIQEGIYALLSSFVGVPPASLIAISLVTRVREILTALPGVATWLFGESIYLLRAFNISSASSESNEKDLSKAYKKEM